MVVHRMKRHINHKQQAFSTCRGDSVGGQIQHIPRGDAGHTDALHDRARTGAGAHGVLGAEHPATALAQNGGLAILPGTYIVYCMIYKVTDVK